MIHPTAIIHPKAQVDPTVEVGPFAIIDEDVVVGPGCKLGPYVYLSGQTVIGARNVFHPGCVIGHMPQDLKFRGEKTRLRIGDANHFRENVTVHRATAPEGETIIGSNSLFMAGSHVAHDCVLGNHLLVANGALLAGHVVMHDRAFASGNCLVHQFVRLGTLAMMQGGSAISKDLPPFTVVREVNMLCGLNIVGLRRAGYSVEQRLELKKLYHLLFRSGKPFRAAIEEAQATFKADVSKIMLDFVTTSKRGVCMDPNLGGSEAEEEGE